MLNRKSGVLFDNFSKAELEALYIGILASKAVARALMKGSDNLPIFTSLEENLKSAIDYHK